MNSRHWPALVGAGLGLSLVLTGSAASAAFFRPWQVAADAPFSFTRFDAEYSNETGQVYVLGGRLANGSTDGSIWKFDPVTGAYTDTGVDMPVPVTNYHIARLLDSNGVEVLVTFGGRSAAGTVNTVQGYYPRSNTTTVFAADAYPILTQPGGVEVVDNIAYSFGGFDSVVVVDDTYIFDITAPEGSRWTTGPNLTQARSYIQTAVVDGVIYALGGDDWDGSSLIPLSVTEKLDTRNPIAWDAAGVADMPVACDEARAFGFDSGSTFALRGTIVIAGCGQWPGEIAESMTYDVASNTWDTAFPDLTQARRNHAGVFIPVGNGQNGVPGIWIFGGRQGLDTNVLATPEHFGVLPIARATTVSLALNATVLRAGDPLRVDLVVANPGPAGFVDGLFGIVLPASVSAAFGCSGGAAAFFTSAFQQVEVRCLTASPATFPPLAAEVAVSAALPPAAIPGIFGAVLPPGLPPGVYVVFLVVTVPEAFADGTIDPGDVIAAATAAFTVVP